MSETHTDNKENVMKKTLYEEQQFAFDTVIKRNARGEKQTVIKGAAGTGKTRLLSDTAGGNP